MSSNEKSKILVDGNCIVCDFEISHYRRIAPSEFEIVDISDPAFRAEKYNLSSAAVNRHMHVISPDGKVHKGVDAFAHIWSRIPRYKFARALINFPLIHPLALVGYEAFARVRLWLPKKRR